MGVLAEIERRVANARERVALEAKPERWPRAYERAQNTFAQVLTAPELMRFTSFGLRKMMPTVVFGRHAFVSRFADVVEVLETPEYFRVVPIYAHGMEQTTGAFILGMDDPTRYEHEARFLRAAVEPGDFARVKELVAHRAQELLEAAPGRIDAASGYAHKLALSLVAEYFGVKGPDEVTFARWMRTIFWELFFNLDRNPKVTEAALASARELNPYLEREADEVRRVMRSDGQVPDTFFVRLIRSQADFAIDDEGTRRNIAGVIVGAVDTLSKAIVQALDQLLKRPRELARARAAAQAGEDELVGAYAFEALRFNPHNPIILRHTSADYRLARGTNRETVIPQGTTVYAGTLSAMFDASVLPAPHEFRVDRPWEHYIHFGRGMHRCFGERFNRVVIPQAIKALLLRPRLRRAAGPSGHIQTEGPFPTRLMLEL